MSNKGGTPLAIGGGGVAAMQWVSSSSSVSNSEWKWFFNGSGETSSEGKSPFIRAARAKSHDYLSR